MNPKASAVLSSRVKTSVVYATSLQLASGVDAQLKTYVQSVLCVSPHQFSQVQPYQKKGRIRHLYREMYIYMCSSYENELRFQKYIIYSRYGDELLVQFGDIAH